jgi:hypothetical protein
MKLKPNSKCICGHSLAKHYVVEVDGIQRCYQSIEIHNNGTYYTFCHCSPFKLDNLKLIEELAKERGLV